jgi:nickel-dependent lactate racemase
MPIVEFGVKSELSLPEQLPIDDCGDPRGEPLDDPQSAMRAALAHPLGYPPLRQTVVQGDRVVLALGEGLVQPAPLVAGAILELIDARIEPESITVLRHATDARLCRQLPTEDLPAELRDRVAVEVHDASDREKLCLLNVSSNDEPIYLNRSLVDADVVVPIGLARASRSLGDLGVHGTLYPGFADEVAQQRFLAPRSSLSASTKQRRVREATEADWFLGTRLVVQVIPGPGETIMQILAGDVDQVEPRAREICESLWCFQVPRRASMVVATLTGGKQQQSWSNFARALDSALRVVQDKGTIAICCDLSARPGPSLRRLARAKSLDAANIAVQRDQTPDALTATLLIRTLQHANVYLLSRLDEDCVESLGVAYIASPDEVARLVSRHDSCILLQNAHQAMPSVETENGS